MELEPRPYGPESTPEEREAIADRASVVDERILLIDELPVQSPFSVNLMTLGRSKAKVYMSRTSPRRCGSRWRSAARHRTMTDVPAGNVAGLQYQPTVHVHYGEKVLAVPDGLPKFKDFPKEFGGSGEMLPE